MIEAVYISLPNTLHVRVVDQAVEAGKHVLCEKPFTRHSDDVPKDSTLADRAGRLLSEAFMLAAQPQTTKLKELVAVGAIGELRLGTSTSATASTTRTTSPAHRCEGGSLMDVGCYNVSGSRLLGRSAERVWARRGTDRRAPSACFTGTMRFPGQRDCDVRLRHPDGRSRRARGDRQRRRALPRRSVALQQNR